MGINDMVENRVKDVTVNRIAEKESRGNENVLDLL